MKKKTFKSSSVFLIAAFIAGMILVGCGALGTSASAETSSDASSGESSVTELSQAYENGIIDTEDLFTKRDLAQTADLSEAVYYTLSDNEDISITDAGVYVVSGTASEATILVDTPDDAKVQIVLDGVSITNADFPCIYVKNADKTFLTTTDSENTLTVTGSFRADGDTNTDAVIFRSSLQTMPCLLESTDRDAVPFRTRSEREKITPSVLTVPSLTKLPVTARALSELTVMNTLSAVLT